MRTIRSVGLVLCLIILTACFTSVTPGAGQEAVLVMQPWIFGSGGVDPTPVKTGQMWVAPSTTAVLVNMQPELRHVKFNDLMSSDGVPLDFDATVRMKITNSVQMVTDFGVEWFKNNVEPEFMKRVRDEVKRHGMNETAISTTAVAQIDSAVTVGMIQYIASIRLPAELMEVTVGKANPPDAIKHQRVETAAQEQRVNTERQRKLAEDARLAAERSRAAADNAYRNAMDLSPDQFIRLEDIKSRITICTTQGGSCHFVFPMGTTVPVGIR